MRLNPKKNYYKYQVLLHNNAIYSTEDLGKEEWYNLNKNKLNKDPVFLMVFSCINKELKNLHPGRWTSMCMETKPSDVRLRPMNSDDFLFNSLQSGVNGDEKYIVFSCIKINNKNLYFVCSSEHFTNYCFSTASSNSFIRVNYDDLVKWSNEPNQIRVKKRSVKARGDQPIYHFWTGTDLDKNLKTLDVYLNISHYIENANYAVLNRINNGKTRVDIPQKIRLEVDLRYNNICALINNKTCKSYDLDEKVWPRLPKHQHHIVPEEWFLAQNNRDSETINNINNIVLLCEDCHHSIHGGNEIKKKMTLDNVLDAIKSINKFDDFIHYLEDDLKITLPILYSIYGVDYE